MSTRVRTVVTFEFRREADQWLGECLELGTATFGASVDEVAEELADLVALHLQSLQDADELERFFENHKIPLFLHHAPDEVPRRVPVNRGSVFTQFRSMSIGVGEARAEAALA